MAIKKFKCDGSDSFTKGIQHGVKFTGDNGEELLQLFKEYGQGKTHVFLERRGAFYCNGKMLLIGQWIVLDHDGVRGVACDGDINQYFTEIEDEKLSYLFNE